MQDYDAVVMGDINLDWVARTSLSFPFSDLNENGRIEWTAVDELPGGSGLNFARFALESGFKPILLGKVGGDTAGRVIREWLMQHGLDSGVGVDPSASTGKAFIARDLRDIRFLVNNTPNANRELSVRDVEEHAEAIARCGLLYVSGYCVMDPLAPRKDAALRAMRLAKAGKRAQVVFDVVPHQIYRIYTDFAEFLELTADVDIIISEVATMRRFLKLGDPSETITSSMAEETARRLAGSYKRFVLRYGPSGCDEQMIWDWRTGSLLREETGHKDAADTRGYGDRLAIETLENVFEIKPTSRD